MQTLRNSFVWSLFAIAITAPTSVLAYDQKLQQQFEQLDPETRLEQVCDSAVMDAVNQQVPSMRADRVIAYTFENPTIDGNEIVAPGASIRGQGKKWFHISFLCQTGPKHLHAHELSYELGAEIPRDEWEDHNLFD